MSLLYKALKQAADQETRKDKPQTPNLMPSASKAGRKLPIPGPAWLAGGAAVALVGLAAVPRMVIFWPSSEIIMPQKQVASTKSPPQAVTAPAERPDSQPAQQAAQPQAASSPAEKIVASAPAPTIAKAEPTPAPAAAEVKSPAPVEEAKVERVQPAPVAAPRRTAPKPAAPKVSDAISITDESAHFEERHIEARDYLRGGQTQLALNIYDELLGRQPTEVTALMGRAAALRRLGRSSESIRAYEEVLNHHPNEIVALTELLGLLGQQSPDRALKRLHRLHTANPGHGPVAAQIALLYAQVGNLQQGIQYMTEATKLQPGNAAYRLNLAVLLDRSGDTTTALRAYETALELAPEAGEVDIPVDAVRRRIDYLRTN